MRYAKMLLCCCVTFALVPVAEAQLLKKLKEKATNVINSTPGNNNTNNTNTTNTGNTGAENTGNTTGGRKTNRGGAGLVTTPPDVNENLAAAETSFKSNSLGEARYAIQQAILGVEMQIGQKILKGLPKTLAGMQADSLADQVTSTGWGWVGLTIHREYNGANDKQLRFSIANNAAWMQAVNMYLANGGFAQTSGGDQNWKQTKIKGYKAVIEYDENSGYKLSVPLGQTSMLMYEGVNFANEQEFMAAANGIDSESIKKTLGEK